MNFVFTKDINNCEYLLKQFAGAVRMVFSRLILEAY